MLQRNTGNQTLKAFDDEWRTMNAALERLGRMGPLERRSIGRLIVALDLTGSRAESLKQARKATAAMFEAIGAIGLLRCQTGLLSRFL